ncbi:MAG TPA: hypothetical protein VKA89_12210 [Solirubrobacterales bacterium]|nr:hypothetical protein [Solirubrobacterales bacterium]
MAVATAPARNRGTSADATSLSEERATGRSARLFEPSGSTLEDVILGAWEDLAAGSPAECPVCRGHLRIHGCRDCGSELS